MVLDAAFPQMLAGLSRRRLEPVRALIVLAVYVKQSMVLRNLHWTRNEMGYPRFCRGLGA